MATKPDNHEEAEVSRQQLEAALRQCRGQLEKVEAMLLKSKQDNAAAIPEGGADQT